MRFFRSLIIRVVCFPNSEVGSFGIQVDLFAWI